MFSGGKFYYHRRPTRTELQNEHDKWNADATWNLCTELCSIIAVNGSDIYAGEPYKYRRTVKELHCQADNTVDQQMLAGIQCGSTVQTKFKRK